MGQKRNLEDVAPRRKTYYRWSEGWDHDNREFCGVTFVPPDDPNLAKEDRHNGYAAVARGELAGTIVIGSVRSLPRRRADVTVASG